MNVDLILIVSGLGGLLSIGAGIATSYRISRLDGNKFFLSLLLKLGTALLVLCLGFFTYFWQKQLDEIDNSMTETNNTIVALDVFISKYAAAVDAARLDNDDDGGFPALVSFCSHLKNQCDAHIPGPSQITGSELMTIIDYFSSPYPETFTVDPSDLIENNKIVRESITPDIINTLTNNQVYVVGTQTFMYQILSDARKESLNVDQKLRHRAPTDKINNDDKDNLDWTAYKACCAVNDLKSLSEDLIKYGTKEVEQLCQIRKKLDRNSGDSNAGFALKFATGNRIANLRDRLNNIMKTSNCSYSYLNRSAKPGR